MLGWEFPPLFSGGLGVATYGMVKALSPMVDIRLIIPSRGSSPELSKVNIIGLNTLSEEEVNLDHLQFNYASFTSSLHRVPLSVSPYHHTNLEIERQKLDAFDYLVAGEHTLQRIRDIFSSHEVYGYNIMKKVHLFTQLAAEIASDGNFDVIHAHDWITFPAGIQIKTQSGKPLILHVHSLETDRAGECTRNEIYELEKNAMLIADKIFAVSQFTKDQVVKHYGIDSHKITVVHNGIEPMQRQHQRHQLKDKLVVFLGRLTHQKGPDFLIETAEKVLRVYPRVKFVVAGMGDQFAHALETSAYKKLGSKFLFTGFLTKAKVNELLAMADVYFMPSVSEPFGLTALEAAQHQVPSILSNQSGAAEVIKSSLKADFWDTDKYANYIYALLKYNNLGKELTKNASHELRELTWENTAKKILENYGEMMC
jgi:glycogen synthase